ncbi:hypothetical protein [Metapseudomonas otitidis]|uniref:Uncharacterized protein n=1 Tax=Metapseudomonas otitidis TaxID=319939 RepID=A0A679GIL4_9GAMM|nr:hypothetical protein [Pseudomonas otitidis]BCA31261.1 hypothetical protein PtoMrB4_52380 [Pseudomonas otitidis]
MARRFKPSYEWAVKLSEKAAQEQQISSSFVGHWEAVLKSLDAEFDTISEAMKERVSHVFEAALHCGTFHQFEPSYPDDETKVGDYLYGRKKVRRWCYHDAVPQRFHQLADIPDSAFQARYSVSARLELIKRLNEVKSTEVSDRAFFATGIASWEKERRIADLEHQIAVNWTICRLLEKGGVDGVRRDYQGLFERHRRASSNLAAAKARLAAEKDARRLLAGQGKKK